ncbi:MAG TPA: hypothetical protein VNH11_11505 [Pirellulales bacterium]|nr:hypothetical protein [Pirellulales bacterium]
MAILQELEKEFSTRAMERHGVVLMRPAGAMEYVARCAEHSIEVLGIDGFRVDGDQIQPLMEHSIDLSLSPRPTSEQIGSHEQAVEFLKAHGGSDLWFEIVVDA